LNFNGGQSQIYYSNDNLFIETNGQALIIYGNYVALPSTVYIRDSYNGSDSTLTSYNGALYWNGNYVFG
jgi:hypothetical protein